jgi:hypothetical protein
LPQLDGIGLAMIVIGLVLAVVLPLLSYTSVQPYLPLPRTQFGKGAGYGADEALSCVFILGGMVRLLGVSPLSDPLHEVQVIVGILFAMAVIGACLQRILFLI